MPQEVEAYVNDPLILVKLKGSAMTSQGIMIVIETHSLLSIASEIQHLGAACAKVTG